MGKHRRHYGRLSVPMPVEINHTRLGSSELLTTDLSDGGVFLKAEPRQCPPVGDEVTIRVVETLSGETPSDIRARVVRLTSEGMGLEFL